MRYRLLAFSRRDEKAANYGAEMASPPKPAFHFSAKEVHAIVDNIPEPAKRAAILDADQCLEHRFFFRGLEAVHFPRKIDWDFSPHQNLSWSWDLNRHPFFLTLGTAYHYTQNAVYLDKLVELWQDWMQRNPAAKGLNWRSPFEVAARLRNWIWAYFLLSAAPQAGSTFLRNAWAGITEHAAFLADHLEYHWPNNHLLLQALTLCEFAVVFREHGGERYLPMASRILAEQVEQQVLADGVHAELCPMYHEIVATELDAFAQLCRKLKYPIRAKLAERIAAMRRFSSAMRRNDGSFPLLGDSSPSDTCLRFGLAESTQHLAFWVQPEASRSELPVRKPLSLDLFAAAGYAILRDNVQQSHLMFDFGSWSRCKATNHGHSDALSFELHSAGRPWIVDSGFFYPWSDSPPASLEWSRYFRSTAAHNTLLIDAREPFELSGNGDVSSQPATRLVGYRSDPQEVAVCGETQPSWSSGETTHRREIVLKQTGEVVITDSVSLETLPNAGGHRLQWFLHFAADLSVQLSENNTLVARCGDKEMTCQVSCPDSMPLLRLIRGQELPRQGWVAQSTAVVVPAWVLVVELESPQSCEVNFHFSLAPVSTASHTQEECVCQGA